MKPFHSPALPVQNLRLSKSPWATSEIKTCSQLRRVSRRSEGGRGGSPHFLLRQAHRAGADPPGQTRRRRLRGRAQRPGAARDVSAPRRTPLPEGRAGRGGGRGAQRGLRCLEGEVETCAAKGGGGAMTLFHFGNCFALAYFPYFITYKCSGL